MLSIKWNGDGVVVSIRHSKDAHPRQYRFGWDEAKLIAALLGFAAEASKTLPRGRFDWSPEGSQ